MSLSSFYFIADEKLKRISEFLISNAVKPSTQKTYGSAYSRYLKFCNIYIIKPLPATEETIILYVSYLFKEGLKSSTIRGYLSAIRFVHLTNGFGSPLGGERLNLVLKGTTNLSSAPNRKKRITYKLLQKMCTKMSLRHDEKLIKAYAAQHFLAVLEVASYVYQMG